MFLKIACALQDCWTVYAPGLERKVLTYLKEPVVPMYTFICILADHSRHPGLQQVR